MVQFSVVQPYFCDIGVCCLYLFFRQYKRLQYNRKDTDKMHYRKHCRQAHIDMKSGKIQRFKTRKFLLIKC